MDETTVSVIYFTPRPWLPFCASASGVLVTTQPSILGCHGVLECATKVSFENTTAAGRRSNNATLRKKKEKRMITVETEISSRARVKSLLIHCVLDFKKNGVVWFYGNVKYGIWKLVG